MKIQTALKLSLRDGCAVTNREGDLPICRVKLTPVAVGVPAMPCAKQEKAAGEGASGSVAPTFMRSQQGSGHVLEHKCSLLRWYLDSNLENRVLLSQFRSKMIRPLEPSSLAFSGKVLRKTRVSFPSEKKRLRT